MTDLENMTPSQKAARQRRLAARRGREYRLRKKLDRCPLPRTVDGAIVESLAFLTLRETEAGQQSQRVMLSTLEISKLALRLLKRDGYDVEQSGNAIVNRLGSWERDHRAPANVPSLSECPSQRPDRQYPKGAVLDEWMSDFMQKWSDDDQAVS